MKKKNKNQLPDIVAGYIAAMQDMIEEDPEMKKTIFKDGALNKKTYWNVFETVAMKNYIENGNPVLSPEQFKEVFFTSLKIEMEKSINDLKKKGILEENENGELKIADNVDIKEFFSNKK